MCPRPSLPQLCNIAFVKTHKTASTTLAYLLFRYGRRHHKKVSMP